MTSLKVKYILEKKITINKIAFELDNAYENEDAKLSDQ